MRPPEINLRHWKPYIAPPVYPSPCSLLESFKSGQRALFAVCLAGPAATSAPALVYLWDHRVNGRPVFPGAAYFEMAAAAARALAVGGAAAAVSAASPGGAAEAALQEVAIVAPLLLPLPAPADRSGSVVLQASFLAAGGAMAIQSVQGGGRAKPTLHMDGQVAALVASQHRRSRAPAAVLPSPPRQLTAGRLVLSNVLQQRQPAAYADLAGCSHDDSAVTVSPAVLDCCLQLAAVPTSSSSGIKLRIPAGVALLVVGRKPRSAVLDSNGSGCQALARPSAFQPAGDGEANYTDYSLARAGGGMPVCAISEMEARPLGSTAAPRRRRAAPAVVGSSSQSQQQQADVLYSIDWLTHSSGGAAAAEAAVDAASGVGSLLPDLTCGHAAVAAAAIAVAQQAAVASRPTLTLVTQGAEPDAAAAPAGTAQTTAAMLWAIARTIAQELPSTGVQAIDI